MKKSFGVGKMVDGKLIFTNGEGEQTVLLQRKTTTTTTTTVVKEVIVEEIIVPNFTSSFVYDEDGSWDIPVLRRKK